LIYPFKLVIFDSYVNSPEGKYTIKKKKHENPPYLGTTMVSLIASSSLPMSSLASSSVVLANLLGLERWLFLGKISQNI
jgi:hypothetical protein